jgi:hypothetical protein
VWGCLREPAVGERRANRCAADVGRNPDLEPFYRMQRHDIVLDFANGASRAEVELLPDDFAVPLAAMSRPRDGELLRAFRPLILEHQADARQVTRLAEMQIDDLGASICCAPAATGDRDEGAGNRVIRIFRRGVNARDRAHVQPLRPSLDAGRGGQYCRGTFPGIRGHMDGFSQTDVGAAYHGASGRTRHQQASLLVTECPCCGSQVRRQVDHASGD